MTYRSNETVSSRLVRAALPIHATTQAFLLDVRGLLLDDSRRVVADHRPLGRIIRVGCANVLQLYHFGTREWKVLVVPNSVFPGPRPSAAEGRARTIRVGKGPPIERNTEDDFVRWNSLVDVVVHCLFGIVWC